MTEKYNQLGFDVVGFQIDTASGFTEKPVSVGIKFTTPGDFQRGIDILLETGAVNAFPDFSFLCTSDQLARVTPVFLERGIQFAVRQDIPGVLDEEAARSFAQEGAWATE